MLSHCHQRGSGAPTTMCGEPTRPQTLRWNGRSCLLAFSSHEKAVLHSVSDKATELQIPPGMKWLTQGELRGRTKVTLPYSPGPMFEPNEDSMDVKVKLPHPSQNELQSQRPPSPQADLCKMRNTFSACSSFSDSGISKPCKISKVYSNSRYTHAPKCLLRETSRAKHFISHVDFANIFNEYSYTLKFICKNKFTRK